MISALYHDTGPTLKATRDELVTALAVATTALIDKDRGYADRDIMALDGTMGFQKLMRQLRDMLRAEGVDDDGAWDLYGDDNEEAE